MRGQNQSPTSDAPEVNPSPDAERPAGHLPAEDAPGTTSQRPLIGAPKVVEDAVEATRASAEENGQSMKSGIERDPISGEALPLGRDRSEGTT